MKSPHPVLTCRTLWHCEFTAPARPATPESTFRDNTCAHRFARFKPRQMRHWTRRVLHQPLTACRT